MRLAAYAKRALTRVSNQSASGAGARRDVGKMRLIGAVGGAADQDEAPVAIAAVDIAMLVDLQEHARMAERNGNAVMRAVARDAGLADASDLGRRNHGVALASAESSRNVSLGG